MTEDPESPPGPRNLQTYLQIAHTLNLLPLHKELTVDNLAQEAKVSWITARKALYFFHSLRPILPTISLTDQGGFQITEKASPWSAIGALETPEIRVLAKLAILGVTKPEHAVYLTDILSQEEVSSLPGLVAEGMLASLEDGRYFLSSRGITIGATGLRRIMEMGIEIPPEIKEADPRRRMEKLAGISKPRESYFEKMLAEIWNRQGARLILSPRAKKSLADSFGITDTRDFQKILRSNATHFLYEDFHDDFVKGAWASSTGQFQLAAEHLLKATQLRRQKPTNNYVILLNRDMALEASPFAAKADASEGLSKTHNIFLVSNVVRMNELKDLPHRIAHFDGSISVEEQKR